MYWRPEKAILKYMPKTNIIPDGTSQIHYYSETPFTRFRESLPTRGLNTRTGRASLWLMTGRQMVRGRCFQPPV